MEEGREAYELDAVRLNGLYKIVIGGLSAVHEQGIQYWFHLIVLKAMPDLFVSIHHGDLFG